MRPLVMPGPEADDPGGWGTPPVDPSVVNTPSTPEAQAATQSTQAANESARAAASVSQLAPPPVASDIVPGQRITPVWALWLNQFRDRSGGASVRVVGTTAPLAGGGPLSGDLTLSIPAATASGAGHLTAADWAEFNAKQAALGFTPVNKAGDTVLGDLEIASTTAATSPTDAAFVVAGGVGFGGGLWMGGVQQNFNNAADVEFVHRTASKGFAFYVNGGVTRSVRFLGTGAVAFDGNVGFNAAAPIAKPVLNTAATDAATTMALVNQIRSALINYGLCS